MSDRPQSIAEMLEATFARKADAPTLGVILSQDGSPKVRWFTWREHMGLFHDLVAELNSPDVVVDMQGASRPYFLSAVLATHWCGGIAVSGSREALSCATHSVDGCVQDPDLVFAQRPDPSPFAPPKQGIAEIQFTSGTSGAPRGVVLTHENLVSNTIAVAETIAKSLDEDDGDEVRLSFLPFHHLYARICDLYCWVYRGSKLVLAESRETIFRDCQIAKPTSINGVPYFYQKAIDVADRQGVSLRELLGGSIRRCYSGGAALSPSVQERFFEEGIPLLSGYGLSEASPVVTVSTVRDNKIGTVGKPLPGVEVRIADDGEVLVRGPNVMLGYWDDEAATAEVIRDGWLHTGDLGEIDADGFLSITGRKKELFTLSTGKNVSPSHVEALLAASPWIEQVAVVGDGRNCLGALIVPNPDRVRSEVRRRRLWVWSKRRALAHPAIRSVFAEEIASRLAGAAPEEQVRSFKLIGRAFDADRGEITAKLSLRRGVIDESFEREIEWVFGRGRGRPGSQASNSLPSMGRVGQG